MTLYVTLFVLGLFGGFLSGLLGIGGGIIMVPLLLYVPPALGEMTLGMKTIAGITAVQSFVGAVSGAFGHHRYQRISKSLVYSLGGSMALGGLGGSVASLYISADAILFVFAAMALVAAIMMLIPKAEGSDDPLGHEITFNRSLTLFCGVLLGTLSGIIGQGGAFLFIPVMIYILHIPTRVAIGSALAIGILSSIAVLAGRIGTSQIPYLMSIVLTLGVVIGAQLGSFISQRTPRLFLRRVLAVLISASAIKIWYELLANHP